MGLSYALFLDLLLIPCFPLVISELDESYLVCYQGNLLSTAMDKGLSVFPSSMWYNNYCTVSYQMTVDG